jgi:tetratricopeptide (TPR) repeat protein
VLWATAAAAQTPTAGDSSEEAWTKLILQGTYLDVDAHDYAKAEQVFLQALKDARRFGASDVRVGATENRLGLVYRDEKKTSEAEAAFRAALPIFTSVYGEDSIDTANVDFNLASALMDAGKYPLALPYLQMCLETYKNRLGPESVNTAAVFCMIGDAWRLQRDYRKAEEPLRQCAAIREADGGILDKDFGEAEYSLALVYEKEGKYALADSAFRIAEKIREHSQGITSAALAEALEAHAALLKEMGKEPEAAKDQKIALAIRKLQTRGK